MSALAPAPNAAQQQNAILVKMVYPICVVPMPDAQILKARVKVLFPKIRSKTKTLDFRILLEESIPAHSLTVCFFHYRTKSTLRPFQPLQSVLWLEKIVPGYSHITLQSTTIQKQLFRGTGVFLHGGFLQPVRPKPSATAPCPGENTKHSHSNQFKEQN